MSLHVRGHLALGSSVVVALVIAACGGGEGAGPQVPGGPAASGVGPEASATAVAPPAASAPAASGSTATDVAPPPAGPMKPVGPSAFAEDLKKLGLDPLKPQPLNKLPPNVLRKLMPTFAKSLGVKCEFCHDNNNFKAWTPHKRVASKMWDEFVVKLALDEGGAGAGNPLYCDSCHGGKAEFLDRHDKKALTAWMDANYVSKLKRSDKKDHGCETCHGDPFEPHIVEPWEKAK